MELAELSARDLEEISAYLLKIYGHQQIPMEAFPDLLLLMQQDKKNEDHRINFTLLDAPGKARINGTATPALIKQAILYYNGLVRG